MNKRWDWWIIFSHSAIFEGDLSFTHQFENISIINVRFVGIRKLYTPRFESVTEALNVELGINHGQVLSSHYNT